MAFYAGRVILHPAMANPTIIVLTDRNDLDDQLFGTFARCGDLLRQPPKRFRAALASRAVRRLGGMSCDPGGRLYLNIGHTGLDSRGFRTWVRKTGVRPVYFVHDLIPLTDPDFCRPGEDDRHRARMRTVLSTASGVIGNSQSTLDDLARFSATEGLQYPPALAAWLGGTPLECSATPASEPDRPTFVVLGTIEARKNHLLLLNIWSRLVTRLGADAPRLLIIGQRGWEVDEVCRILDTDALRGHVVELNDCSDQQLASHLASARALLFPSKAEGFGLPLVEALRLGVPVVASDLPVFHEIGQGIPMLLDPANESSWEAAILDFAQPASAARDDQLERLAGFRSPTWNEHLQAVESWLGKLASDSAVRVSSQSAS